MEEEKNIEETTEETVENNVEEVTNIEEEQSVKEEVVENISTVSAINSEKKNKNGIVIALIILVALVAVAWFAYTKLFNTKNIFIRSINKGYAEFEDLIDESTKNQKDIKTFVMSNDMSFNLDVDKSLIDEDTKEIIDEVNKLSIKNEIGFDQKNQKMLLTLDALYSEKDLINVGAYLQDEKVYVELKNIFDKYIEIPVEEYGVMFDGTGIGNASVEDVKYILSKSKDAIINNLDGKKFKKSNATIDVDGKNVKTTKITYTFDEKSVLELSEKVVEDISKDSKYIKILAKVSGMEEKEIKDALKEAKTSIKEEIKNGEFNSETEIKLSVFVKGITRKNAGYELEVNDEYDGTSKMSYYKNGKTEVFKMSQDKEDIITATSKDDKTVIKLNAEGEEIKVTITKKESGKTTNYDFTVDVNGMKINGKLTEEIIKENKDGSGESKVTVEASMMGLVKFKISDTIKLEYKDKLELPNISNSVNYEELSEEDYNKIMTKLGENETLVSLIEKFSSYSE